MALIFVNNLLLKYMPGEESPEAENILSFDSEVFYYIFLIYAVGSLIRLA